MLRSLVGSEMCIRDSCHIARRLNCNSLLSSAPKKIMQFAACSKCCAAAHLVTGTRKYKHDLSRLMHDDLHWLVIPQRVQYKFAVTVHRCLRHRAPRYLVDYCVPVSKVPGRQHLRSARIINCQFLEFAIALLGPVHFLLLDQQSAIHCLIICAILQLLTPNNLGRT